MEVRDTQRAHDVIGPTMTHLVRLVAPHRRLDGPLHRRRPVQPVRQEEHAHGRLQRELEGACFFCIIIEEGDKHGIIY